VSLTVFNISYKDHLKVCDYSKKGKYYYYKILCLISLIDLGTGIFELYGISKAGTACVIRFRRREIPIQLGVILSITGLASCEVLCGMHMVSTIFLKYV
jgi:hypothetical protein